MAMDLNDGFDDDDLLLEDESQDLEDNQVNSAWVLASQNDTEEDEESFEHKDGSSEPSAIDLYLKDNGIEDKNKIKFLNDNGEIEERSWDSLSSEELLNILRSNVREPEEALDDSEISFLNKLRYNGISPELYEQWLVRLAQAKAILDYENSHPVEESEPVFTSDQLTDEELFILDMQSRVEDITDEELQESLATAKENPDLFEKLMRGIRAEYQRLETEQNLREAAIELENKQLAFNQYSGIIQNQISNLSNIGDLDINMDYNDMDELSEFILGSDEQGVNNFQKALQDPETLVQMAWFALHGEDIFNGISDYYNQQIIAAQKDGYRRGMAARRLSGNLEPTVAYKTKLGNNQKNNVKTYKSISDLFED